MPKTPGAFPLTHLWFLYQLLWLYAGTLLLRGAVARLDRGQGLRGLVDRGLVQLLELLGAQRQCECNPPASDAGAARPAGLEAAGHGRGDERDVPRRGARVGAAAGARGCGGVLWP